MLAKLFISYRRDDSAGHAGRVHDRLVQEFGRDVLFMDVDAVPLGSNFAEVLRDEVSKCDMLLAIIGPNWLEVKNEQGIRRLEDPTDFVRIEIAAALRRDIPVIPILLESTRMPNANELPDDLKELSLRNALHVRHASFHLDMEKLLRFVRGRWGSMQKDNVFGLPEKARAEEEMSGNSNSDAAMHSKSIDMVWLLGIFAVICVTLATLIAIFAYIYKL